MSNRIHFLVTAGKSFDAWQERKKDFNQCREKWKAFMEERNSSRYFNNENWLEGAFSLGGIELPEKPKGWKNTQHAGFYEPSLSNKEVRMQWDDLPTTKSFKELFEGCNVKASVPVDYKILTTGIQECDEGVIFSVPVKEDGTYDTPIGEVRELKTSEYMALIKDNEND